MSPTSRREFDDRPYPWQKQLLRLGKATLFLVAALALLALVLK